LHKSVKIEVSTVKIRPFGIALYLIINLLTIIFALFSSDQSTKSAFIMAGSQIVMILTFYNILKIYNFSKREYVVHVCNLFIIISVISAIFAYYVYTVGSISLGPLSIQQTYRTLYRLTGWYGSPNRTASVFCIASICIIYILSNRMLFNLNNKSKYILFAILILNILSLLLTGSRGSMIAFIFGLVTYILMKRTAGLSLARYSMIIISVVLLIIAVFSSLSLLGIDRYLLDEEIIRYQTIDEQLYGRGRVDKWITAMEMYKNASSESLLFGHGIGTFIEEAGTSTHNGYLSFLIDRGLIILILLIGFIGYIFKIAFQYKDDLSINAFATAIFVQLLIKNFFNDTIPTVGFAGIAFLMSILLIVQKDEQSTKENLQINSTRSLFSG